MCETDDIDFEDDVSWDNSPTFNVPKENKISNFVVSRDDNDEEGLEQRHLKVLSDCFGHNKFRTLQWKIIRSIIIEKKDVCAVMATGYGKSLCYQFPSVYSGGVTLVISPLISLMEDQVLSLKISNIPACLLGSAQNKQSTVLSDIMSNEYRIIYATPEFCTGEMGVDFLKRMYETLVVDLLAIDEAHCVSQWGHDFRVKYRQIFKVREILKDVPVLAVTATATRLVRDDIISSLKLKKPNIYCSGFDRPNLFFEVALRKHSEPIENLKPYMVRKPEGWTFSGPTIIYCLTKQKTEDVANNLTGNGVKCLIYHASLTLNQRKKAHEQFVRDHVKVIAATIAFGMGIDKPDVRMVIHYGASKDVESYYQEVGRAGRDGSPSRCILLHSNSDYVIHDHFNNISSKQKDHKVEMAKFIQKYIDTLGCRRKFILDYFQDEISNNNVPKNVCCDNCKIQIKEGSNFSENYSGLDNEGKYDISEDAKLFLGLIQNLNGLYGLVIYVMVLRGSRSSKINNICMKSPFYGKGKDQSEDWWKNVGNLLEREGYLKKVRHNKGTFSYNTIDVSATGAKILTKLNCNPDMDLRVTPTKEMAGQLKLQALKKKKEMTQVKQADTKVSTYSAFVTPSTSKLDGKVVDLKTFKVFPKPEIKKQEDEDPLMKKYRMDLYNQLMKKRADIAYERDCMPYMVGSNMALMQMSKLRPKTLEEFKKHNYDSFTAAKIEHIGKIYVELIKDYCSKNQLPCSENSSGIDEDFTASQNVMDTTTQRLDEFNDLLLENVSGEWDDWDADEFQPKPEMNNKHKGTVNKTNDSFEPFSKKQKIETLIPLKTNENTVSDSKPGNISTLKNKKKSFSWDD